MAKVNYSFKKKQRELETKRKQEKKQKEKLAKKKLLAEEGPAQVANAEPTAG